VWWVHEHIPRITSRTAAGKAKVDAKADAALGKKGK
jgi:hypothetical protein